MKCLLNEKIELWKGFKAGNAENHLNIHFDRKSTVFKGRLVLSWITRFVFLKKLETGPLSIMFPHVFTYALPILIKGCCYENIRGKTGG